MRRGACRVGKSRELGRSRGGDRSPACLLLGLVAPARQCLRSSPPVLRSSPPSPLHNRVEHMGTMECRRAEHWGQQRGQLAIYQWKHAGGGELVWGRPKAGLGAGRSAVDVLRIMRSAPNHPCKFKKKNQPCCRNFGIYPRGVGRADLLFSELTCMHETDSRQCK